MQICAVVPVYNHDLAIGAVVAALRRHALPCILVDDGSSSTCAAVLDRLVDGDDVRVVRHALNQGKGAAVLTGLRRAAELGYSHALQIDADGQHDSDDVPMLMAAAKAQPDAVVTGFPIFDGSVPKSRFYGRYVSHVWVWINTLSLRITDAMCGFRIYPVGRALAVADATHLGRRMDFDTEILVRLDWAGVPVVNLPTKVRYPLDGVSHFQLWRDNVQISAMHARLFFGMLPRFPRLLLRLLRRGAR